MVQRAVQAGPGRRRMQLRPHPVPVTPKEETPQKIYNKIVCITIFKKYVCIMIIYSNFFEKLSSHTCIGTKLLG